MKDWPKIPHGVVESVAKRWPERALRWAALVEAELREVCEMYDATPRNVLPARYGFVVATDSPRGGLVLRSSPDPDAWEQAEVAYATAALGVGPVIHETIASIAGLWTVMDEVRPGTPLALTDRDSIDLESLASVFSKMRGQPAPEPRIASLFDWIRNRLEDDNLSDLPVWRDGPASNAEREDAIRILDDLSCNETPGLCHGDASTFNVLASEQDDWKLVDPRGVAGEVEYDIAVIAFKLRSALPSSVAGRIIAQAAGARPERVAAWMTICEAARV